MTLVFAGRKYYIRIIPTHSSDIFASKIFQRTPNNQGWKQHNTSLAVVRDKENRRSAMIIISNYHFFFYVSRCA